MMMNNKILSLFAVLLFAAPSFARAEEKVVFSEDFSKPDALNRWHKVLTPGGNTYAVENGKLAITLRHKFRNAGYIEVHVPVVRKGRLDFDLTINPENVYSRDRIGMTLDLYNIYTFFHDFRKEWRFYDPQPNSKRIRGFILEPAGHRNITKIKHGIPIHYRIEFDTDQDVIEFYAGNMDDPALGIYDAAPLGRAEYHGGTIRIGSFGYIIPNPYKVYVDNIRLTEIKPSAAANVKRDLILVYRGVDSKRRYRPEEQFKKAKVSPELIRSFDLHFVGANNGCTNNIVFSGMPGRKTLQRAKTMLLLDSPAMPVTQHNLILNEVKNGLHLIICGGLFTLGKGDFINTPIGNELPVKLETPWEVKGSPKQPLTLQSVKGGPALKGRSVLYHYHDHAPVKDAKVLMKAGNKPILTTRSYGKGRITVFSGTTSGPDTKDAFWNTSAWTTIFQKIILER